MAKIIHLRIEDRQEDIALACCKSGLLNATPDLELIAMQIVNEIKSRTKLRDITMLRKDQIDSIEEYYEQLNESSL